MEANLLLAFPAFETENNACIKHESGGALPSHNIQSLAMGRLGAV